MVQVLSTVSDDIPPHHHDVTLKSRHLQRGYDKRARKRLGDIRISVWRILSLQQYVDATTAEDARVDVHPLRWRDASSPQGVRFKSASATFPC